MSFKLQNGLHKRFVVFVNYGLEGWKIHEQTDDAQEALKFRDQAMSCGNEEVVIFSPAQFAVYLVDRN